jgi:type I restriction enzyme S subunit
MTTAAGQDADGWQRLKLQDVCELIGATINPQSFKTEMFAHYSIPAFDHGQVPTLEKGEVILSNKIEFPNQAVLFSKLNPRIARVWFVNDSHSYRRICSTEFLPLRPNTEHLLPEFFVFALQEPTTIQRLRDQVAAATKSRERLKPEKVLSTPLLLPPLEQQRRIAGLLREQLSILAEARGALEAQLAAAESLPAAHLRAVFETTESEGWPKKTIGEMIDEGALTEHQDGNHGELHPRNKDFVIEGVKFVTAKHINNDGTVFLKSAPCISAAQASGLRIGFAQANDVLLAHNATVGKVGIAPPDCDSFVVGTSLTIYRANEAMLNSRFIFYALRSMLFQRQLFDAMKQTTRNQVPITKQRTLSLPVPSPDVQHGISAELTDAFTASGILQDSLRAKLSELEKLPAALLHSAFNPNGD